ncbi:Na+/H+ antiporter NhaA [soil metagenome]
MALDERHPTWATSNRFVPRTFVRPILRFSKAKAASGIFLLVAATVALAWANSPWAETYFRVFQSTSFHLSFGPLTFDESISHLINDGLMAIFFFVVGLEIKRELVLGDLRHPKAAALPVIAAIGGMIVPAIIYLALTSGLGPEIARGWGIPMATDIAFVLGVVALLGSRVPAGGKLFILSLAIVDDIGAIVVIALFYADNVRLGWLATSVVAFVTVWAAGRAGVRSQVFYVPVALVVWFATYRSGVHATLAGVALGLLTPARALYSATEFETKARHILDTFPLGSTVELEEKSDHEAAVLTEIATESIAPLNRLEIRLLPWTSFVIVPLFALANAGITLRGNDLIPTGLGRVAVGVGLGLLAGKIIGITTFSWLAVRTGLGRLPAHTGWQHIFGLAAVAGIGFTVSLFVTSLALPTDAVNAAAKIGIFAGSLVAGVVGFALLRRLPPAEAPEEGT